MTKSESPANVVRAYHLVPLEHGLSSISRRRLKVARISEVNDPFERFALSCLKATVRKALTGFKDSHDKKPTGIGASAWDLISTRPSGSEA